MQMDMELVSLLKVIWRWLWLTVLIVAATCGFLYWNAGNSIAGYTADVVLLISTPDREDVSALDDYTFTSDRDEITIVINKLVEIAQYPEVQIRTLRELNIEEAYTVAIDAELGADFVHVTVTASSPELAAQIANAHAANAIAYFGELRALPANQASSYFEAEIIAAEQALQAAETALNSFQTEHGIVSFERELDLQYDILEQLELSRTDLLNFNATGIPTRNLSSASGESVSIVVTDADIRNLDALILAQRQVLANIAALEPAYKRLADELERATETYDSFLSHLSEVEMRGAFSSQSMFIQVIQAATVPSSAEDNLLRTMVLGAVGSLGFAILATFFLDYLFSKR